ncbi:MAG: amidase family protein, partial [Diaphorobacter nitroreducens]
GRAAGPMTRGVEDAALMMQVLSQPDARDSMSLPAQPIDWRQLAPGTQRLRGLRLGLLLDAGCGLATDPEVRAAVQAAAQRLADAGAIVEPMEPFLTRAMLDGMDHFWRMRSHMDMRTLTVEQRGKVLPYIRAWADSAATLSAAQVYEASQQFHATRVATVRACAGYDYVLSPVAPITAFAAELPSPTDDPLRPLEHIAFTVPFNMSEQPAASVNCGYSASGLPIGLQIAGQRFDDLGVLQLAHAFEQLRGAQRPWPAPPAP